MHTIGMTQEEQDSCFRIVSGILHLGNLQFGEDQKGNAYVVDRNGDTFVNYVFNILQFSLLQQECSKCQLKILSMLYYSGISIIVGLCYCNDYTDKLPQVKAVAQKPLNVL